MFTYFNYDGHELTGLVYLDVELEKALIIQMESTDQHVNYCWYSRGEKLLAKPEKWTVGFSYEYEFRRDGRDWLLLNKNDVVNFPAHN